MAEFKFPCSACGQNIKVDELWSGHQLECPACHAQITVPANPAAAAAKPAAVRITTAAPAAHAAAPAVRAPAGPPPVPAGPPKLAIGAQKESEAPKAGPVVRNFVDKPGKKQSGLVQALITVAIIAILGGGGWFGYDYYRKQKEAKEAEIARQAEEAETAKKAAEAEAAKKAAEAAAKPMVPPTYTLDVAQAKISDGKANGSISGGNFVVDSAKIDKVGQSYVVDLRQGTGPSADRQVLVYLHLKPNDGPTNQSITVASDAKNPLVSQVAKLWKTDPKYAPQRRNFFSGYAMKLELGKMTENVVEGKIFLALPDNEKSVVAGVFKANMGQTVEVTEPTPAAAAPPSRNPEFDKRYGIRR